MLHILKPEVKQLIKNDVVLKAEICALFNKRNPVTVDRWVAKNSPALTIPQVLDIIRVRGGLAEDAELLVPAA